VRNVEHVVLDKLGMHLQLCAGQKTGCAPSLVPLLNPPSAACWRLSVLAQVVYFDSQVWAKAAQVVIESA
jgi:hypothetical protein